MNGLKTLIGREIEKLPEPELVEVLDYILFLERKKELKKRFELSTARAREIARREGLKGEDVNTAIREVRSASSH
jgi:hypothetical protein